MRKCRRLPFHLVDPLRVNGWPGTDLAVGQQISALGQLVESIALPAVQPLGSVVERVAAHRLGPHSAADALLGCNNSNIFRS